METLGHLESKRNSLDPVPSPMFNSVVTTAAQEVRLSCQFGGGGGYTVPLSGFSACGHGCPCEEAGEAGPATRLGKPPVSPPLSSLGSAPPSHIGSAVPKVVVRLWHILISEVPPGPLTKRQKCF